jgi:hypothetical protein
MPSDDSTPAAQRIIWKKTVGKVDSPTKNKLVCKLSPESGIACKEQQARWAKSSRSLEVLPIHLRN